MASEPNAPRSRRALLTAAASAAAAAAASAALPASVAADDPNDVVKSVANPTTNNTSITNSTDASIGFQVNNKGVAPSVMAWNAEGLDNGQGATSSAAVFAFAPSSDGAVEFGDASFTGVYGFSPTHTNPELFSAGIWGDSPDVGTYGSGSIGVMGDGSSGVVGRAALGGIGVFALNFDQTGVALRVDGKVVFSRSKRSSISAGRSSVKVTLPGTTSSSRVFAVLSSNRSGRYVRAVVPTTGSFTIYLNGTVSTRTNVDWFVVN